MDKETALAILKEAAAGDYLDRPIPEDELDIIDLGQFYYDEAVRMNEEFNMNNEVIQSIIRLGGGQTKQDKVAGGYSRKQIEASEWGKDTDTVTFPETDYSVGGHEQFETPVKIIPARENLPIPEHIEADPVEFPNDISKIGDNQVRSLSGIYGAYLARVIWLLAQETSRLENARLLLEHERGKVIASLSEKPKLKDVLESLLYEREEFRQLKKQVVAHESRVNEFKALKEIYQNYIDRLSREAAIRHQEWERSR